MEEAYSDECHSDVVLVASLDDIVVTNASSCLCDILNSALVRPFNVVSKGEESIATQANTCILCYPGFFLLHGEDLWFLREELLPCTLAQHIVVVF